MANAAASSNTVMAVAQDSDLIPLAIMICDEIIAHRRKKYNYILYIIKQVMI